MINADHLLENIDYITSPNFNERPRGVSLDLIVIHAISLPPGEFSNNLIPDFFSNKLKPFKHPYYDVIADLHVASHVVIKRDGNIIQFAPFDKRAWHAGKSEYQGRQGCNDFSIGIELEGWDYTLFTKKQYTVLVQVINALLKHYPTLSAEQIVGHSEIAPGRKTDPGAYFDWDYFFALLREEI